MTRNLDNALKLINKRIALLRKQRNIKQAEFAEQIGISQTNLSNIERGRTAATLQNLLKMRAALGCKMADFFVDIDVAAEEADELSHKDVETLVQLVKLIKSLK